MTEIQEEHLRYFGQLAATASHPQWKAGFQATTEWIRLDERGAVTQAEFDAVLGLLESLPDEPGHGGWDLWHQLIHWGYEAGLLVPDRLPWNPNRDRPTCCDVKNYVGLTLGQRYRIVASDAAKDAIRVVNDQHRTRWYPWSCFVPEPPVVRRLVRKPEPLK